MCELEASFQHRSMLREPKNIFRPVDIYFFFSYEDRPREEDIFISGISRTKGNCNNNDS